MEKATPLASLTLLIVCAFVSEAQTLTATYVALADSADYYIRKERWHDAERVTVQALRHEPANKSNYLLWSNLGIVRTQLDDFEGAMQAYEIGLACAPHSTTLLSNRARTLLTYNRTDDALADLDSALALDSLLQWPLRMRGLVMLGKGKPEAALDDLKRYLDHYPDDATIRIALGDAESMLGHYDRALEHYEKAEGLDKDSPEATEKILLAAYADHRLAEQEPRLKEALREWPRHAMFYLLRGTLHRQRYQTEDAELDKKLAVEYGADPHTVEIFFPKSRK